MTRVSKLTILLSTFLLMSSIASVPTVLATTPNDSASVGKPITAPTIEVETSGLTTPSPSISPQGSVGSGWKPDVPVAASSAVNEMDPSIASYIDPVSGAVTLYTAVQRWDTTWWQWVIDIYRSFDYGATWSLWRTNAWSGRDAIKPSIAVSPYNGTVWVATESYSPVTGNDILMFRNEPTYWTGYNIDADFDDDRNPELISEYSFGSGNYLYVSYEMYWTFDDRDLFFGVSYNWGLTWTTQRLRGGWDDPTGGVGDVFIQSSIAYAQRNLYIAYRHSTDYATKGHIDVTYSTDYGWTWNHRENVSAVSKDASWPSVAGSHIGPLNQPTSVIVAYEYNTSITNHDILYAWTRDYGTTWTGGNSGPNQIAASPNYEMNPHLTIDGMGTEDTNVGGSFRLVYMDVTLGSYGIYYTELSYWDTPVMLGPTPWAYYLGWSSPRGLVNDPFPGGNPVYPEQVTITTYKRTVGSETLWEPGVAWTDFRTVTNFDVYYSTPGTYFSIAFTPSSQSVVAGKSISYYVTVNLVSGPAAPAYLSGTNWPWIILGTNYAKGAYSVSPITPTATSKLTVTTSNLMPAGNWQFNATATIGGYRRIVSIPFTVTAPPTLTLDINPTSVPKGGSVTFSGQLTPGATTKIYIFYRYPHITGTWKLAATLSTTATGAYTWTITIPTTAPTGQIDFVAFWVNLADGSYATSPIQILTIT